MRHFFHKLFFGLSVLMVAPSIAQAHGDCHSHSGPSIAEWVDDLALAMANMTVSAEDRAKIRAAGGEPYDYMDGWGWVRTDFYAVTVTLPENLNPRDLLDMIRDNPNGLGKKRLKDHVGWPASAGKNGRKKYDIVNLKITGNNGAISYVDVDTSDGDFTAITVKNKASGSHPVSGARTWGFNKLTSGKYIFWTTAIESANVWGSGGVGALLQDGTWKALVRDIGDEVQQRGGQAHNIYVDDEWQNGGLKPGRVKAQDLDSSDGIDQVLSVKKLEAAEERARQALKRQAEKSWWSQPKF
jgi:hypothetical protein